MPPAVWLGPVKSACTREGDEGLSLDRGQILGRAVAQQGAKLLISSSATGKGAAGPRRRGERCARAPVQSQGGRCPEPAWEAL